VIKLVIDLVLFSCTFALVKGVVILAAIIGTKAPMRLPDIRAETVADFANEGRLAGAQAETTWP